jgi:hypothetical protein
MGSLKPGATYVHESIDNVVYAKEVGSESVARRIVGWNYDITNPTFDPRTKDGRPLHDHVMEDKLWGEIRRAAKTNTTLQEAIERVKIIYHLSKDNGK